MKTEKGFSLVELIVAVVIIAILAAVAIPGYQNYVVKGNRAAAQSFMMDLANREKQYLLDARTYADFTTLGVSAPADVSKHYAIAISAPAATPPIFIITATPPSSSQQFSDDTLTLGSDGTKDPSAKW